ncbi:MAG: FecR domain-containing protein [Candidatus Saccharimonadales bacterium]|nr:FecR domain-containing protein [Candidatus Saccharimonadales bacterium]
MAEKEETTEKKEVEQPADEPKKKGIVKESKKVEKKTDADKPAKPAEDADQEGTEQTDEAYNLPDAPIVEQSDKYTLQLEDSDSRRPVMQGMGKMLWLALIALLIAAAGIGFLFLNRDDPVKNDSSDQSYTLGSAAVLVEGTVEQRTPGGDWSTINVGDSLAPQTEIRTGSDGRVVVNIDDGSAIRLDYDSEARLSSLKADNIVIDNTDGQMYSRVVASEGRTFEVSIGEAEFVSVGTAFRTLNTADQKGVETFESKVKVKSDETEVEEGKGYYTKNPDGETDKVVDLDIEKLKDDDFIKWNKDKDGENDAYKDKLGFIGDFEGPSLKINNPPDGKVTDNSSIDVQGITEAGATVTINGKNVDVQAEGEFDHKINLEWGKNTITVIAKDANGNTTKKTIKVTRQSEESKEEEKPETQSITLSGEVDSDKGKIFLEWSVNNVETTKFKVVWAEPPTKPEYPSPNDGSMLVADKSAVVTGLYDKTYYFRVCAYDADTGKCTLYSNKIQLTAPAKP